MAPFKKTKLKIKKKVYYLLLFLIFILIFAQTIYLLSALTINTKIFDNIQEKAIRDPKIVGWMIGKYVSYIVNAIILFVFLLYISLARSKTELGFFFLVFWVIMFVALVASPHVLEGSHDEIIRLSMGIISSIASGFIIITLLYLLKELFIKRRNKHRELYQIFKKKGGLK